MNNELLGRHYDTLDPNNLLIYVVDIAMYMQDGVEPIEVFDRLGGDVFVQGNHDLGLDSAQAPFPILQSCVLHHGDYQFYCTHRPEEIPEHWREWVMHGHHHDTVEYPFIAYDERRINVSSELLDYRPLTLQLLVEPLERCPSGTRLRDVQEVEEHLQATDSSS